MPHSEGKIEDVLVAGRTKKDSSSASHELCLIEIDAGTSALNGTQVATQVCVL